MNKIAIDGWGGQLMDAFKRAVVGYDAKLRPRAAEWEVVIGGSHLFSSVSGINEVHSHTTSEGSQSIDA